MKMILLLSALLSPLLLQAQEPKVASINGYYERRVPIEVRQEIASRANLKISTKILPIYLVADFDGDGKPDNIVWIEDKEGNCGLWFKLSSQQKPIIMGCGYEDKPWKNWSSDSWVLFRRWQPVEEPDPIRDSPRAPKMVGDYLVLSENEKGSCTVYWDGKRIQVYTGE